MNMASLIEVKANSNIPTLASGDTVKVKVRVSEGEKERAQTFQGVVIRIRHSADGGSFTVRRVAYGIGVERTFLFQSPLIEKVEIVRHGKVRRAKLYYLRGLSTKAARIKERRVDKENSQPEIKPEPKKEEAQEPQEQ
jgi:large subunit ribosomal protein L19